MPKELFQPTEYESFRKYLQGPLKILKTVESTHSHTTLVYWIKPTSENESHVCDDCGGRAQFLIYDKDHMAQTSINLYCGEHGSPQFQRWLNEADF